MEGLTAEDVQKITSLQRGTPVPEPAAAPAPTAGAGDPPAPAPTPTPTAGDPAPAGAGDPPAAAPTFDFTKFGVKTPEELQERLGKISEYEKQINELSEYKNGPKFKSDRQKFLYDFANQVEGMELERARQLLEVTSLDLKTAPDQRIRFEAFRLRPENNGLSHEEVYSLFTADEEERFGNPSETNPQTEIQKIRAKQATAAARKELETVIEGWNKTRTVERTPAEIAAEKAQYAQFVQQQLTGFDGIPGIKLTAQNEKGEKLESAMNFKIDPANQLPSVIEALQDPAGWWDRKLEELQIIVPGTQNIDVRKFGDLITRIEFQNDLLSLAYQQGRSEQLADQLKGSRRIEDPSGRGGLPPEAPKPTERKEANREAMKAVGLI